MRSFITPLLLLACSPSVLAGNYATCILDEMPEIQNDATAYAAAQVCAKKYPSTWESVQQGSGRGWFGFDSGAECALEKSSGTSSYKAAYAIRAACNRLYDMPNPFEQITTKQR